MEYIRFDGLRLPNNFPTVTPPFAKMCRFNPFGWVFSGPGFRYRFKRLLDAEVSQSAFFSEEPSGGHSSNLQLMCSFGREMGLILRMSASYAFRICLNLLNTLALIVSLLFMTD
jgi:hypothetical protein